MHSITTCSLTIHDAPLKIYILLARTVAPQRVLRQIRTVLKQLRYLNAYKNCKHALCTSRENPWQPQPAARGILRMSSRSHRCVFRVFLARITGPTGIVGVTTFQTTNGLKLVSLTHFFSCVYYTGHTCINPVAKGLTTSVSAQNVTCILRASDQVSTLLTEVGVASWRMQF